MIFPAPAQTDLTTSSPRLQEALQRVVDGAVDCFGCLAAVATTLEQGHILQARAFAVTGPPTLWSGAQAQLNQFPVMSETAVDLHDPRYCDNLSVQALTCPNEIASAFLATDDLYDLVRPLLDRKIAHRLQKILGFKQGIVLPFQVEGVSTGVLVAVYTVPLTDEAIQLLTLLGHQAAIAVQNQQRLEAMEGLEQVILMLQTKMTDEVEVLQAVVDAVVQKMGYAGAMVATLEAENALPVRAYSLDVGPRLVEQLEKRAGLTFLGPNSVVYLEDERYQDNLSVRALKGRNGRPEEYLVSDDLHDLLRPLVNKALAKLAQKLTGIKQVIAVPFYLDGRVVGNLFAATRRPTFDRRDISVLTALGRQAAVGIYNARLYRVAEERRQIAQMFGRMAFSAATSVHALRNHIGVIRSYVDVLELLPELSLAEQKEILVSLPDIGERLNLATRLLDNLHEPWHLTPDHPVGVNDCLIWALGKVFPGVPVSQTRMQQNTVLETGTGITVRLALEQESLLVMTAPDMLTEAFRILIKNATEALRDRRERALWIASYRTGANRLEVSLRDNGHGIKPEHLSRLFDMGWSTKQGKGMGFGLFWTHDFVDGLGGKIRVESTWQEGTTFFVTLPTIPPTAA